MQLRDPRYGPVIRRCVLGLVLALILPVWTGRAEVDWPQLKFTPIGSPVSSPVHVTGARDGSNRLFVTSQTGKVFLLVNDILQATPFLDISARVLSGGERGLLSIAFPPNYAAKRYFYVNYTRQPDGATVISRFRVPAGTPNQANPASEEIILVIPQPYDNHNGGQIAFGPDGNLYIGMGDGGSEGDPDNQSQTPNSLLGKMLRIDVEGGTAPYAVPATNPFVGNAAYQPEIWALGLRNPWRFSFDRQTGDLFIGDVGQYAWEEIDMQPAGSAGGQNYGWRIREGNHDYIVPDGFDLNTLTSPVAEYPHIEGGLAVTGGFVYRGPPTARLNGIYFLGDFIAGKIFGLKNDAGNWVLQLLEQTNFGISTFGEDDSGRLYLADIYSGNIYRVDEDLAVRPVQLNPPGNYFSVEPLVQATCATLNAVIHYTINGIDPTVSDPIFPAAGLQIVAQTQIRARAFRTGFPPGPVVTENYFLIVAPPEFNLGPTTVDPAVGLPVWLTTITPGAIIRYTLDGSVPNESSAALAGTIQLSVGGVTVKAIGFKTGFIQSTVVSQFYDRASLTTPMINPSSGQVYFGNAISITGPNTIHYTLDGSDPTPASPVYTGPFYIDGPLTVSARAFATDYNPSAIQSVACYLKYTESGSSTTVAGFTGPGYLDSPTWYLALFRSPEGICAEPAGTMVVADTGNHAIRRFVPYGEVTTIAGNGTAGYVNANGTAARFSSPRAVCRDSSGNFYVADDGNNRIRKIDPQGNVTTYAGSGVAGNANGPALSAQFRDIQQIQIDSSGNLFVGANGRIRKIDPQRNVTTLAVLPLSGRVGLTLDPTGQVYATSEGATIYQVASNGIVISWAGGVAGYSDGTRNVAEFSAARGLACDSLGYVYVCDGDRVRKILRDNWVWTMVDVIPGGGLANLNSPHSICVDNAGVAWIADTGNHRVRAAVPSDWEHDGIPDSAEGGLTPYRVGVDDRLVDTDGDGQSNAAEYRAHTDPLNAASRLAVQSVFSAGPGQMTIVWSSLSGVNYQVEYSTDLTTWLPMGAVQAGTGAPLTQFDINAMGSQRFYRVTIP